MRREARSKHLLWLLALPFLGCNAASDARPESPAAPTPAAAIVDTAIRTPAVESGDAGAPTATPAAAPVPEIPFKVAPSPSGSFTAAWRPFGGAVPVNELFALELLLFRGKADVAGTLPTTNAPLPGAAVQVTAWMPEHMHGMNRLPEVSETAPGRYVARGLMLHMGGFWQLFVDVMVDGKSERVGFDYRLESEPPAAVAGFTPEEVRAILELSPLPDPPADPTNAHAADPRAARLGQHLFYDVRFSSSGAVACATCHRPDLAFADGKHFGEAGNDPLDRHTPSLFNVAYQRWWFWDGRADSLWSQALHPIEESREFASSRLELAHAIAADAALKRAYVETFGPLPELADAQRFPPRGKPGDAAWDAMAAADQLAVERVFVNFGKALAAYERRLVSRAAPFDEFVAGVRSGDAARQAALAPAAREGLKLFVGAARCVLCHSGPNFSDREFHDNRVPTLGGEPRRDPGRMRGIPQVQEDRFNGAGPFSDAPGQESQEKLRFLPRHHDSWSEFKTPTLRNVALTAPYMHQGQFATLDDVLAYYDTLELAVPSHSPERTLAPLDFAPEQLAQLRAFLESLTDAKLDPELLAPPPTPWQP